MKPNPDKFIVLGNTGSYTLQIGDITIKSASSVTLLSATVDSKLNFNEHINNIVKKHVINYMPSEDYESFKHQNIRTSNILACSIIKRRFVYCPLIWMFCSKTDM